MIEDLLKGRILKILFHVTNFNFASVRNDLLGTTITAADEVAPSTITQLIRTNPHHCRKKSMPLPIHQLFLTIEKTGDVILCGRQESWPIC